MPSTEYRVSWKREGLKVKRKRYATRKGAERFLRLFGPEPWTVYAGKYTGPDDRVCCSGYECGCEGLTYREQAERDRREMPKLEWLRLEQRVVGSWSPTEAPQSEERS